MTTTEPELYLIDEYEFDGTIISSVSADGRVHFSGYLYNDMGPDLTVDEYIAHPKNSEYVSLKVVTWDELEPLIKAAHRRLYTDKPVETVTDATYVERLSVLPPEKFGTCDGMEYFMMSERLTGSITAMYARKGKQCVTKLIDLQDRSTWITAADFATSQATA